MWERHKCDICGHVILVYFVSEYWEIHSVHLGDGFSFPLQLIVNPGSNNKRKTGNGRKVFNLQCITVLDNNYCHISLYYCEIEISDQHLYCF